MEVPVAELATWAPNRRGRWTIWAIVRRHGGVICACGAAAATSTVCATTFNRLLQLPFNVGTQSALHHCRSSSSSR